MKVTWTPLNPPAPPVKRQINPIRYGANYKVVGKTDPQKLSYSGAWEPTTGTFADLATHIGQGHPWMPALLDPGERRYQHYANRADVIALDIDSGMSIEAAKAHPFIATHCSLAIESNSSTPEQPKYRLVFRNPFPLEKGVQSTDDDLSGWQIIKVCVTYLQSIIGVADPSCKDASRFFFGAVGRQPFILDEFKALPESFVADALNWYEAREREAERQYQEALKRREQLGGNNSQDTYELVKDALSHIPPRQPGSGNYPECISVLMALYHEFGEADAIALGEQWSPSIQGTTWDVPKKVASFRRSSPSRPVTIGSLFHLAKQYGFRFPERREEHFSLEAILNRFRLMRKGEKTKSDKQKGFNPKPPNNESATPTAQSYEPGHRIEYWTTQVQSDGQYTLEHSGTGTGKSFDAGRLDPEQLGVRQILYLSDEHRNPPTETLAQGWEDLEARHQGLTQDDSQRLRRAKAGDSYSVPPNCSRNATIAALRQKNIQGADSSRVVCMSCPLQEACQHSEGAGYGFLVQRRDTLLNPRVRLHPDSLPSPDEYDYSNVVLIWEEVGQSWDAMERIQVTDTDVATAIQRALNQTLQQENRLIPVLLKLSSLLRGEGITGKNKRYGLNHQEVMAALPELPTDLDLTQIAALLSPDLSLLDPTREYGVNMADLPRNVRRMFAERDTSIADKVREQVPKQWLLQLVAAMKGDGGYLSLHNGELKISLPNERFRQVAQAAKHNLFLDATETLTALAQKLGVPAKEIHLAQVEQHPIENLELLQVVDLGKLGKQRGNHQEKRLNAIVQHYRTQDPTTKLIDYKRNGGDGSWWVDSRGVNAFEDCNTLILAGTPCPNLIDLLAEYHCLIGRLVTDEDEDFRRFVAGKIEAEYIQAIGRTRANRRPETAVKVIILSDFQFQSIETTLIKASDITLEAATKKERMERAIEQAVKQLLSAGKKVTQTAIARLVGVSQGYVSRFRQLLQTLLDSLNSKSNSPATEGLAAEIAPVLEDAIAGSPPEEVAGAIHEIFFEWVPPPLWPQLFDRLSASAQIDILGTLIAATGEGVDAEVAVGLDALPGSA